VCEGVREREVPHRLGKEKASPESMIEEEGFPSLSHPFYSLFNLLFFLSYPL